MTECVGYRTGIAGVGGRWVFWAVHANTCGVSQPKGGLIGNPDVELRTVINISITLLEQL